MVAGLLVVGGVALGAWAYGSLAPHPNATVPPVPLVIKIGTHLGTSCSASGTATHCSIAAFKIAAYSSVVFAVMAASTTAPSAVSGTLNGKTFASVTSETGGSNTAMWLYLVNNATAHASATLYANFTAGTIYTILGVDVQNVTTSALDGSAGVNAGTGTTASCQVTTTVFPDLVVEFATKTATSTVGTWSASGGDAKVLSAADLSSFSGSVYTDANGFTISDGSTGLFTESATMAAPHQWSAVCLALKTAPLPVAPTSFATGAITTTTVPLTWVNGHASPVLNTTIDQATYSGGSCGAYTVHHSVGSAQAHAYTVTGLTSGNHYCFRASNWNSSGQGAFSTVLSNVVTAHAPPAPSAVTATASYGSTTFLSVGWTNPLGTLTSNDVYYGTTAACGGSQTDLSVGVETFASVGPLSAGTTYYVQVSATNATGLGAKSACVTAATYATPAATSHLAASSVTSTTVTLSWTNPSGVTNDTLLSGTTCGTWIQRSVGAVSTVTLGSLNPNTKYCFSVEAWASGVVSTVEHPYLNVTTVSVPPSAPSNIHPTANTTTSVALKWTQAFASVGSITNDTVYYGTVCGTWAAHLTTGGPMTTYTLAGLSGSSTYCVAVGAWTSGGEGSLDYVNVTTLNGPPTAPTGLAVVTAGQHQITFHWTEPSGTLVNNTVAYSLTAACAGSPVFISTGGPTTSWTLTGLVSFTHYYVEVSAWTSGGVGPYSSCVTMISQSATPPAPIIDTHLTTVGNTWVDLVWSNPASYSLFNNTVYYGPTCAVTYGGWAYAVSTVGVTTSFNVTGLTAHSTYCFSVTAWDGQSNLSLPFLTGLLGAALGSGNGFPLWLIVTGVGAALGLFALFTVGGKRRRHG